MTTEHRFAYSDAFGHGMRPYLTVRLSGVAGHEFDAVGLVDSGADTTCLPMLTVPLLGFGRKHLEPVTIQQLGRDLDAWQAVTPVRARLVAPEGHEFELMPVFVPGSTRTLWGRDDFFRSFERICFHELDWAMTLAAAT